jgi:hypothetical protein
MWISPDLRTWIILQIMSLNRQALAQLHLELLELLHPNFQKFRNPAMNVILTTCWLTRVANGVLSG